MSNKEVDSVLEGLTEQELKDTVVKNVAEVNKIKQDAKAYAKSCREAIKALEERNEDALELIEIRKSDKTFNA